MHDLIIAIVFMAIVISPTVIAMRAAGAEAQ